MQPTRAPWSAAGPPAPQSPVGPGVLKPLIAGRAGFPPKMTAEELASNTWKPAAKRITDKKGLDDFLESDLAKQYVGFILALNAAVAGRPLSDESPEKASPAVTQLLAVFSQLEQRCEAIPPEAQSLRYGNPAFRTWFAEMRQEAVDLVACVLPEELRPAAVELAPYFIDSFGNQMRIDYGTGHETNFCVFLFCLARLGVVEQADARALVLRVFHRYIQLMRKIQTTYWLEPAGSHGVWGLDDYHFLPFVWGSSQLVDHPEVRPKSVNNDRTRADYEQDYMYLQCVSFVKQVKKGPLSETSPMLYDVSAVPSWTKVNSGLLKMYQVEVLSKLPIMQHFLFSSMVPFPEHGASG